VDLPVFQASWVLEELEPERVHEAATELLARGIESPSLIRLAGMLDAGFRDELAPIVDAAFGELGLGKMPEKEARWILAFDVADQIVGGRIEPLAGAKKLWVIATDLGLPGQPLNYFVYLAADYGEGPSGESWFDEKIVETAHELLALRSDIVATFHATV
jgi:hypothetical protein